MVIAPSLLTGFTRMIASKTMPHSEADAIQAHLQAVGIKDAHLLSYLLDRENGMGHAVAMQRLCSQVDIPVSDRVSEVLVRLAPAS